MLSLFFLPTALQAQQSDSLYFPDTGIPIENDISLLNQQGEKVAISDLRGKVWVVNFFYTSCPLCNKYGHTRHMAWLYSEFKNNKDVVFVSISMNPVMDTPETLALIAGKDGYAADPKRWLFLTGTDAEPLYEFIQKSLKQPAALIPANDELADDTKDVNLLGLAYNPLGAGALQSSASFGANKFGQAGPSIEKNIDIEHSFRFLVIDSQGRIRGAADGKDFKDVKRVPQRVQELIGEKYYPLPANYYPTINASLNGLCGILIVLGYIAIRSRMIRTHKIIMLSAMAVSAIFLACYLYYHFAVMDGQPTRFTGQGPVRIIYLAILLTHTILAAIVAPMALISTYLGLKDKLSKHKTLARWTLPIWLYVSVTGVIVYVMLYHLYPSV